MRRKLAPLLLSVVLILAVLAPTAFAGAGEDLAAANRILTSALELARSGKVDEARAAYQQFHDRWYVIEEGIRERSRTAYKAIEDEMADVQFALLKSPVDPTALAAALTGLEAANQKFVENGYPADGGAGRTSTGSVSQLLALLETARDKAEAGDAAAAAQAMQQFRNSWLEVEGMVLTQSAKVYADAEQDMVAAHALLSATPPDLAGAVAVVTRMREYLAPIAAKTSYSVFDAATILLREGLEALLVIVALLSFLNRSGHGDKAGWIWGGVGAGLGVSAVLAVAVKLLFGTGAFGSNNFLITGWSGIFAAVMLVWVSYWLHSKSSLAEWNRYIRERSNAALATGNLFSLAALAFLAVFREGTETVLFYIGMASSITMGDLLAGLGIGFSVLLVLAVVILKVGLRIPMRPFFLVSSILVFYLGLKFTGMGIQGLQLAGVLPVTVAPYLPSVDFLALYPNWQSTIPQLALLVGAVAFVLWSRRRDRIAMAGELKTQNH